METLDNPIESGGESESSGNDDDDVDDDDEDDDDFDEQEAKPKKTRGRKPRSQSKEKKPKDSKNKYLDIILVDGFKSSIVFSLSVRFIAINAKSSSTMRNDTRRICECTRDSNRPPVKYATGSLPSSPT